MAGLRVSLFHEKQDPKTSGSCRSPRWPALQRFRVLRDKRIDLQLFDLLLQPSRVGASDRSKYFAADPDIETL
jgi:hypothetical protein